MSWRVHFLEAEGDLSPWRERIGSDLEAARQAVARVIPPPRLDILVQRLRHATIPEIGMGGRAYRKGLLGLTLDPDNPRFEPSLRDGALSRQVIHEAHHCLRMGCVGYGRTLGEALVSEGLAGHFVGVAFGTPAERWEQAVDDATLAAHFPDMHELAATDYDHAGWFFGAGGRHPRWLGYTLGYRIVGDWLAAEPLVTGSDWVCTPAATILAAATAPRYTS